MKPIHILSATLMLFTVSTLLFGIEKFTDAEYEGKNLTFKSYRDSEKKELSSVEKINPIRLKAGLKNETKFLLDSVLTSDENGQVFSKHTYTYDNHGNELSYESIELDDSLKTFVGVYKYINTFTNDDKQVSSITYSWDITKNEWLQNWKAETTFNKNGLDSIIIDYEWDTDNKNWSFTHKDEYNYYQDSTIKEYTSYNFDKNKNTWINNYKNAFDYNTEENFETLTDYNWDSINNNWLASLKQEYFMDSKDHTAIAVQSLWVEQLKKYFVMDKVEYAYLNDKQLEISTSEWLERYWSGISKSEIHYDSLGRADGQTYFSYSYQKKNWIPRFRYEIILNQNGDILTEIRSKYDNKSDTWTNDFKRTYEYDNNGNTSVLSLYAFDTTWQLYETVRYYFSEKVISNLTSQKKNIILAQNPVRDLFIVKGLDSDYAIKVFDLKGNLVLHKSQNGNKPVNVQELHKGMYIYKIIYREGIVDGKMIKE
jgi:hypothetical protein